MKAAKAVAAARAHRGGRRSKSSSAPAGGKKPSSFAVGGAGRPADRRNPQHERRLHHRTGQHGRSVSADVPQRLHPQFRKPGIRRPRRLDRGEAQVIDQRPDAVRPQLLGNAQVPEAIDVEVVHRDRLGGHNQCDTGKPSGKAPVSAAGPTGRPNGTRAATSCTRRKASDAISVTFRSFRHATRLATGPRPFIGPRFARVARSPGVSNYNTPNVRPIRSPGGSITQTRRGHRPLPASSGACSGCSGRTCR